MAKVLFGGGVAAMVGKLGGVVFSAWRGIGTARKMTKPASRFRTTQPATRSWLGWLSRHFGTLSEADRELWQTWADEHPGIDSFGNPFTMTAQNMYIKLNLNAARLGGSTAVSDTPPLENLDQTIQDFAVTSGTNPGEIDLDWSLPNVGEADDFIELKKAGPFASPALTKTPPEMDSIGGVAGTSDNSVQGSLVEGTWYWFCARYVGKDGQTGNWHVGQATPLPTP